MYVHDVFHPYKLELVKNMYFTRLMGRVENAYPKGEGSKPLVDLIDHVHIHEAKRGLLTMVPGLLHET